MVDVAPIDLARHRRPLLGLRELLAREVQRAEERRQGVDGVTGSVVPLVPARALVAGGASLPGHDERVDARLGGAPAGVDLGDAGGREGGDHCAARTVVLEVAGDDHSLPVPTPRVALHALDEIWRQSRALLSRRGAHGAGGVVEVLGWSRPHHAHLGGSHVDTMTPVYSAGTLLMIAAVAVAVLLVLIIALRMHAFVALVLVSCGTAVAAGVPVAEVPTVAIAGFGSTLGTVALLVGFGVMIGRLLEVTGGAQVLADTLVDRFGEKRAPLALGVAALLFGLPIFFDAGLVVFLPIIFTRGARASAAPC